MDLTELYEPARQALADTKLGFMDARRKATEAFSNEALKTSDRILAMTIRVMATLLEKVNNPANAFALCKVCLDELHSIQAVKNSFKVELAKGFKSRFNRVERGEVIADVFHINFVIYTITLMVSGSLSGTVTLPCIDIGEGAINPLREARLVKTLREFNMEHCRMECMVVWPGGGRGAGKG